MIRTFQTRLALDADGASRLDAYAALYGKVERTLFAQIARGARPEQLKVSFCHRFGLTARQFNAVARTVKGKVQSLLELRKLRLAEVQDRLARTEPIIAKLPAGTAKRHLKQRKAARLAHTLAQLQRDQQQGTLRLCFGGGKLFRAQQDLAGHGHADHAAWQRAWREARSNAFFVLGSKDETAGCQGCQLTPRGGGAYAVLLRLPHALVDPAHPAATHLRFEAAFAYGRAELEAALALGTALSFRFLRDAKGWRLLVSTDVQGPALLAPTRGVLGVDVHADHLALTLMDGDGNPRATYRVPLVTYGCSSAQAKARIGEAVKQVLQLARTAQVGLALEKLDFQARKRALKDQGVRYARMLSSLA